MNQYRQQIADAALASFYLLTATMVTIRPLITSERNLYRKTNKQTKQNKKKPKTNTSLSAKTTQLWSFKMGLGPLDSEKHDNTESAELTSTTDGRQNTTSLAKCENGKRRPGLEERRNTLAREQKIYKGKTEKVR